MQILIIRLYSFQKSSFLRLGFGFLLVLNDFSYKEWKSLSGSKLRFSKYSAIITENSKDLNSA